jgi:hypothetical protein
MDTPDLRDMTDRQRDRAEKAERELEAARRRYDEVVAAGRRAQTVADLEAAARAVRDQAAHDEHEAWKRIRAAVGDRGMRVVSLSFDMEDVTGGPLDLAYGVERLAEEAAYGAEQEKILRAAGFEDDVRPCGLCAGLPSADDDCGEPVHVTPATWAVEENTRLEALVEGVHDALWSEEHRGEDVVAMAQRVKAEREDALAKVVRFASGGSLDRGARALRHAVDGAVVWAPTRPGEEVDDARARAVTELRSRFDLAMAWGAEIARRAAEPASAAPWRRECQEARQRAASRAETTLRDRGATMERLRCLLDASDTEAGRMRSTLRVIAEHLTQYANREGLGGRPLPEVVGHAVEALYRAEARERSAADEPVLRAGRMRELENECARLDASTVAARVVKRVREEERDEARALVALLLDGHASPSDAARLDAIRKATAARAEWTTPTPARVERVGEEEDGDVA